MSRTGRPGRLGRSKNFGGTCLLTFDLFGYLWDIDTWTMFQTSISVSNIVDVFYVHHWVNLPP